MKLNEPDPAGVGDLPKRDVKTDAAGRFKLEGFVPGLQYNLSAMDATRILARLTSGEQFKEGETKDLGDVVLKPAE